MDTATTDRKLDVVQGGPEDPFPETTPSRKPYHTRVDCAEIPGSPRSPRTWTSRVPAPPAFIPLTPQAAEWCR